MLSALNDDACTHIYTLLYKEHTHWTLSLLYNVIDVRSINSEHRLYKSQTRLKSAAKKYRLILSILALSLIEGRFGFDFSSIVRRIAEKAIFREKKKLQPQLGRPGDAFPRKQAQ